MNASNFSAMRFLAGWLQTSSIPSLRIGMRACSPTYAKVSSMHRHWLRSREISISAPTFFSVMAKMQLADATRSRFFPTLLRPSSERSTSTLVHNRPSMWCDVLSLLGLQPHHHALTGSTRSRPCRNCLRHSGDRRRRTRLPLKGPTTTKNSQQRW